MSQYTQGPTNSEGLSVLMVAQRASYGGVTEHIRVLGSELQGRGVTVAVAANWDSVRGRFPRSVFEADGLSTHQVSFPDIRRSLMPLECGSVGRAIAEIRSLVRSLRPDVVHSHWRAVLPYVAAFRRKTSIVHSVHTTSLAGPLTRCVYRVPHRLVAISNAVATDLEALGESAVNAAAAVSITE